MILATITHWVLIEGDPLMSQDQVICVDFSCKVLPTLKMHITYMKTVTEYM